MKKMDDFCYVKEAIMCYHRIDTDKDEWNTKEDTGKAMNNTSYILWYAKRMSTMKKIYPMVLTIIKLRLSEGVSQLLSYSLIVSLSKRFFRIP